MPDRKTGNHFGQALCASSSSTGFPFSRSNRGHKTPIAPERKGLALVKYESMRPNGGHYVVRGGGAGILALRRVQASVGSAAA